MGVIDIILKQGAGLSKEKKEDEGVLDIVKQKAENYVKQLAVSAAKSSGKKSGLAGAEAAHTDLSPEEAAQKFDTTSAQKQKGKSLTKKLISKMGKGLKDHKDFRKEEISKRVSSHRGKPISGLSFGDKKKAELYKAGKVDEFKKLYGPASYDRYHKEQSEKGKPKFKDTFFDIVQVSAPEETMFKAPSQKDVAFHTEKKVDLFKEDAAKFRDTYGEVEFQEYAKADAEGTLKFLGKPEQQLKALTPEQKQSGTIKNITETFMHQMRGTWKKNAWVKKELKGDELGATSELVKKYGVVGAKKRPYSELKEAYPELIAQKEEEYKKFKTELGYALYADMLITKDSSNLIGEEGLESLDESAAIKKMPVKFLTAMTFHTVDVEHLFNAGKDVYFEDGAMFYKGEPVGPEFLTEKGPEADAFTGRIASFLGSAPSYVGVAGALKKGVRLLAAAKNWPKVSKVFNTFLKFEKAHPVLAEVVGYNVAEETIEAGIRLADGQEYTKEDFLKGLLAGGFIGGTFVKLGDMKMKKAELKQAAFDANTIFKKMGNTDEAMKKVMEIKVQGKSLGEMFGESKLAYYKQPGKGRPGIDASAPPETPAMKKLMGEIKTLSNKAKIIKDDYIQFLKDSSGKGVTQGNLIRDESGKVTGRFGRQSKNPQWYRDFFKKNNRAPSKKELTRIAEDHLLNGLPKEGVPVNKEFRDMGLEVTKLIRKYKKLTEEASIKMEVEKQANSTKRWIEMTSEAAENPRFDKGKQPELIDTDKVVDPKMKEAIGDLRNDPIIKLTRWESFRQRFRDKMLGMGKVQDYATNGKRLPDEIDVVLQESLYHKRVEGQVAQFYKEQFKPIFDKLKSSNEYSGSHLRKESNQILWFEHAPEYNKKLGDGAAGITTKEAEVKLAELKKSKSYQQSKEVADLLRKVSNDLPKYLLDNGLISKEMLESWAKNYSKHVSLQRILPGDTDFGNVLGTGRGYDVRGHEIKRAKGSDLEVADIFENTALNWERSIRRANKNKVANAVLGFMKEFPDIKLFEKVKGDLHTIKVDGKEKVITVPPGKGDIITAKVDGKSVYMKINDKRLAKTMSKMSTLESNAFIKYLGPATRFISAINTRFNPEFVFTNFFKDVQAGSLNLVEELGVKGSAKASASVVFAQKGIWDFMRGKSGKWADLYKELQLEGGTTGYFKARTRDEIGVLFKEMEGQFSGGALGMPIRAGKKIIKGIDAMNEVVENGMRLASYDGALKAGYSKQRAAKLAKESTVNFNKSGEWGSTLNSLYAFSNSSIQGSFRTFKALKDPKTAIPLVGTVMGLTTSLNIWNDYIDADGYATIPSWERETNWVVMLGDGEYVKIPAPWGWNVFKVGADQAYDLAMRNGSGYGSFEKTVSAFLNAYNPIGTDNPVTTLIPTIGRPFIEAYANKAWHGGKITPTNFAGIKESLNYYDSTNPVFISIAGLLGDITGGEGTKPGKLEVSPEKIEYLWEQYSGGLGKTLTNTIGVITRAIGGDEQQAKDIPVYRRFRGSADYERFNNGVIFDTLELASEEIVSLDKKKALLKSLTMQVEDGHITQDKSDEYESQFLNNQEKVKEVDEAIKLFKASDLSKDAARDILDSYIEDKVYTTTQVKTILSEL